MNIREQFNSGLLNASDITHPTTVTIESVEMQEIGDQDRVVVGFRGADKMLVLNKTNAEALADLFGDETEEWVGKKVVLRVEKVQFQGRKVDGIRIGPAQSSNTKKAPKQVPAEELENTDDIPF